MAKPICLVYFNSEYITNINIKGLDLTKGLQNYLEDYYVLCVPKDNGDVESIDLKVFHEKDFTEIQYKELKELIESELKNITSNAL